jgi:hypothetical protein
MCLQTWEMTILANLHCNNSLYNMHSSFSRPFNWCMNDCSFEKPFLPLHILFYKHKILEYTLLNYFHWIFKENHMTNVLMHERCISVYISWSNVPVCTCMWSVKSYLNVYLHIYTQYGINTRMYQNIKLAYLGGVVDLRSHFCIGSSS